MNDEFREYRGRHMFAAMLAAGTQPIEAETRAVLELFREISEQYGDTKCGSPHEAPDNRVCSVIVAYRIINCVSDYMACEAAGLRNLRLLELEPWRTCRDCKGQIGACWQVHPV